MSRIENRAAHNRLRAVVLAEERVCWLCGEPPRPGDPLTLDHVLARRHGGTHTRANGRAAHLSCNSGRGAGDRPPTGYRVV